MPSPGDRRGYQSPDLILAEARRMAAEIRRQAERDAAAIRRDAAEWASAVRRDAEADARATLDAARHSPQAAATLDLTGADPLLAIPDPAGLRDAPAPPRRPPLPPIPDYAGVAPSGPSEPAPSTSAPDDPAEVGRRAALGVMLDTAGEAAARPRGEAAPRLPRDGDVIDLRLAAEHRRAALRRSAEQDAAERDEPAVHVPVETNIETKVHDVVRRTVRRTFPRRSS